MRRIGFDGNRWTFFAEWELLFAMTAEEVIGIDEKNTPTGEIVDFLREAMKVSLFRLCLCVFAAFVGEVHGMTSEQLLAALEKDGAPEAELVKKFPTEVDEQSLEFLDGGKYLRAVVHEPKHPAVLHFVEQKGEIRRLPRGTDGIKRLDQALDISIKDSAAALRYARWALEVGHGGAFWLISSVDDVPFLPAAEGEKELAAQVDKARADLSGKIRPPSVEDGKPSFRVTQFAVKGRDLVRYTIDVSRLGHLAIDSEVVSADIPVVYAGR